ncbi:deoxyuridine 5'-triphosphate nucleotidohydrolase [Mytilinidion resinicola]|uniref:Deoxyuridine 5'-triphosphate nucleotidohydrolase n=1 Tax=Mytilinidion resinicola TaxID=574789 RepID=A0A6A6Y7X6_9PEZI|nr:deoxyuridine 5'-triphosphate nucleotidohydrolase [Mytilinidion resinicola]KAF2804912.1 deoxyuridine 5'-triphosphate nucleotidohydrolase [Mytilinidion resinicola]
MIIPGRVALARKVLTNLTSAEHQAQPCGIDLTLKCIMNTTAGTSLSLNGSTQTPDATIEFPHEHVNITCGSYLVEFNELVDMPLDLMSQVLVRSSLFRSGVLINAGVMDSGYRGAVGAMLQVVNPHGLRLLRDAKLAQIVFHQMREPVQGYNGMYQGRTFV